MMNLGLLALALKSLTIHWLLILPFFQDIDFSSTYMHYEQEEEDLTLLNKKIAGIWTICINLFYIIA